MKLLVQAATTCLVLAAAGFFGGCQPVQVKHEVEVKPVKIEPIYIKIDVNVRVDKQLDKFFEFQDEAAPPTTQPKATG